MRTCPKCNTVSNNFSQKGKACRICVSSAMKKYRKGLNGEPSSKWKEFNFKSQKTQGPYLDLGSKYDDYR